MEAWKVAAQSLSFQLNQVIQLCESIEAEVGVEGIKEKFRQQFFRDLSRLAAHCSCIDGFRHENEDKLFLEQMFLLEEEESRRQELMAYFHHEVSLLMSGKKKASAQEIQFPSVLIAHTLEKLSNREVAHGLGHQLILFAQNMTQADGHVSSSETDFLDQIQGNLLLALTIHWGQYKEEVEKRAGIGNSDLDSLEEFPDLLNPQRIVTVDRVPPKKEENFDHNLVNNCLNEAREFVGPMGFTQLLHKLTQPKFVTTSGTLLEKSFSSKGLHLCFTGKDLKQKSQACKLLARTLAQLGYIEKGLVRETSQEEWLKSYTTNKIHGLNEVFEEAEGRVLLIHDCEHIFETESGPDLSLEIQAMVQHKILDYANNTVVVLFLDEEKQNFSEFFPELDPIIIEFGDLDSRSLQALMMQKIRNQGFLFQEKDLHQFQDVLLSALKRDSLDPNYQAVDKIFLDALDRQATRLLGLDNLDASSYRSLQIEDFQA